MGFLEHRRIFFSPPQAAVLLWSVRNSLVKRELAVEHFMVF